MEVQIRINGVLLDGVAPGAVKLTINNPDPIKFSERTVSYSGSITVPRSQVNDRVLRSERFPGYFTRTAPYVAELSFSGLDVPFGGGLFRARVSADPDSYTIELIETVSKLSTLRAPVVNIPTFETPAYQFSTYVDSLNYAYPTPVIMPNLYASNGTTTIELAYVADREMKTAGDYKDAESQLVFKGAHDGLRGSVYAANYMIAENNDVATCFMYMMGSTFNLEFTSDSFIILPPTAPATVYLRSNGGTFALPFARGTVRPDGNYPYYPVSPGSKSCIITPRPARDLNFGFTTSSSSMVYSGTPITSVPTTESYYISFRIKAVGSPTYAWHLVPTMGLNTPFDIVQAFCKAFCWTYEFQSSPFLLMLKPFINPSTSSTYRQNWSGKIDTSTVKVSEAAGAARTYTVKVGELTQTVGGYGGAISTQETAGESNFPVNPGATRPYATMIRYSGASLVPDNYFNRASGYRATIAGHYDRFSPGWQVTAKMNLSYFDIQKMKPDALYFVGELNHWFYLRTLSNWDASTGTANVTLIAVNN
jgi:hypothetical protein|nr:MAG TPA: hypothetical protein [Caudoviricetes sp.]